MHILLKRLVGRANCTHATEPITSGHHLCLMYDLIQSGSNQAAKPPDRQHEVEKLLELVRLWRLDTEEPEKLMLELKHI